MAEAQAPTFCAAPVGSVLLVVVERQAQRLAELRQHVLALAGVVPCLQQHMGCQTCCVTRPVYCRRIENSPELHRARHRTWQSIP